MAGLDEILKGVRSEVQSLLIRISPTERGSESFVPCDPEIRGTIRENTGRPRTFWLEPVEVAKSNMGNAVRRYSVVWALTIGYPATGWDLCAVADYDSITAAINQSGGVSTVSGVGYRVVPRDGIAFERDPNWLWATIKIASIVEAS